jgi:hypothetical protein
VIWRPLAALATVLAMGGALSGCVAAVIPLAAAGTIGKRKLGGAEPEALAAATALAAVSPANPAPAVLPPRAVPASGELPPLSAPPPTGWRALVRHVARAVVSGATCASGTTAVLIDADVAGAPPAERDVAVTSLNALRSMNTSVTFVAADPVAARATLSKAGMAEADTAIATPAEVAPIARGGCVVATGGGTRGAFTGLPWIALPALATAATP